MSDTYDNPSGIGSTTSDCVVCGRTIGANSLVCLNDANKWLAAEEKVKRRMGLDHKVLSIEEENKIIDKTIALFRKRRGRAALPAGGEGKEEQ